jgi:hypothetical protein
LASRTVLREELPSAPITGLARELLRLARLRRQRDTVIEQYGEELYNHVEANLHWLVYQFLGKLQPTIESALAGLSIPRQIAANDVPAPDVLIRPSLDGGAAA